MAQATIKCLQYAVGPGRRRQPRSPIPGAYPSGMEQISCYTQQPPNTYVPGTTFYAPYPPSQFNCGGGPVLYFAFQSVTGLTEGGMISLDVYNPCQGTVGTDPITVINLYVPIGDGIGESGAVIDAFDEKTGSFCDDTFVTVTPDQANTLTNSGNVYGWVRTANSETITANTNISPSNVNFDRWQIVAGTGGSTDTISGNDLNAGINTSPYAFAFFKAPDKTNSKDTLDITKELNDLLAKNFSADFLPGHDMGDPAYRAKIQSLIDKISVLEKLVKERGKSFIRSKERPDVGKNLINRTRENG